MRLPALVLTVLAATPLLAMEKPKEPAERIKELQKERIAVLEKLVDHAVAQFQRAQGSYEDVLEAQMQLLQARLEAAEKESDRVALYERAIEVLTQTAKVAQARMEAGRGTEVAILRIKARRLDMEIKLEQAKLKIANEK